MRESASEMSIALQMQRNYGGGWWLDEFGLRK